MLPKRRKMSRPRPLNDLHFTSHFTSQCCIAALIGRHMVSFSVQIQVEQSSKIMIPSSGCHRRYVTTCLRAHTATCRTERHLQKKHTPEVWQGFPELQWLHEIAQLVMQQLYAHPCQIGGWRCPKHVHKVFVRNLQGAVVQGSVRHEIYCSALLRHNMPTHLSSLPLHHEGDTTRFSQQTGDDILIEGGHRHTSSKESMLPISNWHSEHHTHHAPRIEHFRRLQLINIIRLLATCCVALLLLKIQWHKTQKGSIAGLLLTLSGDGL